MRTPLQPYVLVPVLGLLALLSLLMPGARGWVLPADSIAYDGALRLGPETQAVRAGAVQVGDRIVAVNGVAVSTPEAMHARIARSPSSPAQLHLQSAPLRRTIRMDLTRLEEILARDPQPVLFHSGHDGEASRIEVEAVRTLLESGPSEVVVVWEQGERVIQGPVPLERLPIPWSALLFVLIGVLFALAITWRQVQALSQRDRARLAPPLSALLGGAAAGGLLLLALPNATPPGLALWTIAAWLPWWLVTIGTTSRRRETPAWLVVIAVAVATVFVLLWLGDVRDRAWAPSADETERVWMGAAILAFMAHVGLALRETFRPQVEPVRRILAWLGLVSWAAAAGWMLSGNGADLVTTLAMGAFGATLPLWLHDALTAAWRPVALSVRPTASEGLDALLAALAEHHAGPVGLAWGTAGSWRLLRWEAVVSGEARVSRLTAPAEDLASALSMLEVEGGSLPGTREHHGDDEDPFLGLRFREPVQAILPIDPDESAVFRVFVVILGDEDDDDAPAMLAIEEIAEVLDKVSRAEVLHDLRALAPAGGGPESAGGEASVVAAPVSEPVATVPVASARELEDLRAWIAVLEEARSADEPMEGLEALTTQERAALDRLAKESEPVLLLGEPGLGKRFLAHALHRLGSTRDQRFALLDATMMPPAMLEAALFGSHERAGLVDTLQGGTLALHSLSALPRERLLSVLVDLRESGLRLILIEREMPDQDAALPEELYRVVGDRVVHLVPLRERPDDLLRHADAYLARFAMLYGKVVTSLSSEAEAALRAWPAIGNLAALRELVRTAVLCAEGEEVTPLDLGFPSTDTPQAAPSASPAAQQPEDDAERQEILDALEAADGNKSEAARLLGVSRGKLLRRIDKLAIDA